MPTEHPHHTITETPPVREAPDELRARLGWERIDYAELVVLGAQMKVRQRPQCEPAATGHHRFAPADVVIASCAHHPGIGVLHYDGDYDLIAERTSLAFESEWLAPSGALQIGQSGALLGR